MINFIFIYNLYIKKVHMKLKKKLNQYFFKKIFNDHIW